MVVGARDDPNESGGAGEEGPVTWGERQGRQSEPKSRKPASRERRAGPVGWEVRGSGWAGDVRRSGAPKGRWPRGRAPAGPPD